MKEHIITVGFYWSIKDWELAHTSYRDEDDHIIFRRGTASGNDTQDTARRYFENLIINGGRIVKHPSDQYAIGVECDGIVYTNVDVWEDKRHVQCYQPYHFYS